MSDDDRRRERNGRDSIVVPMPQLRDQRPPVRQMQTNWRTEEEWQRSLTNKVVELVPAVNGQSEQLAENTAQLIVVSSALNRLAERIDEAAPKDADKSYHEFDPAVAALRREMKRRIKDGDDPFDEDQAVEFMERAVAQLRARREDQSDARKWRRVKSIPHLIAEHWILGAVCTAAGGGAAALVHWVLSLLHH